MERHRDMPIIVLINTHNDLVSRLTMEVRETLVKSAKAVCEEAKIGIRRVRQRGMNDVRKQKKAISQDDARMVENYVSYELYLQSYVFYLIKVIS
jgi:hypothetical protein